MWTGTNAGLSRLRDGVFTTYSAEQGLPSNFIYSVIEDDRGDLWFGSDIGVFRIGKDNLNDVADGRADRLAAVTYGIRERHGRGHVQ